MLWSCCLLKIISMFSQFHRYIVFWARLSFPAWNIVSKVSRVSTFQSLFQEISKNLSIGLHHWVCWSKTWLPTLLTLLILLTLILISEDSIFYFYYSNNTILRMFKILNNMILLTLLYYTYYTIHYIYYTIPYYMYVLF